MLQPVDRARDRGRGAELRRHDDEVLCGRRVAGELAEHAGEALARVGASPAVRRDVAWPSQGVHRLLEPELAEVAGDRRLRNAAAGGGERVAELELGADPLARYEAADQAQTLTLAELSIELHTRCMVCSAGKTPEPRRAASARP